jgi:hypothetical protein
MIIDIAKEIGAIARQVANRQPGVARSSRSRCSATIRPRSKPTRVGNG